MGGDVGIQDGGSPTCVDLFSGCGGGSLGFRDAGFRLLGAVEIDRDAASSYEANLDIKPFVRDIREVRGAEFLHSTGLRRGELTALFGCPPCQSFTVMRRGGAETALDKVRNRLPDEYLRLVDELLPRHVAFENVPGMVEAKRWQPAFHRLRAGLGALGYRLAWDVIDAADYGVAQRRRRLVLLGSRVSAPRLPSPTHAAEPADGQYGHRTVRDAIGSLPPAGSNGDSLHWGRRHQPIAVERLEALTEGQARANLPSHLQLKCHQGHGGHYDIYGRMWWDRPAPTLTSGCTNVTRGRFAHPRDPRAITVREALLLQSFPEDTVLSGGIESMSLQVGNAVPPLLARHIAVAVLAMEAAATGGVRMTEGDVRVGGEREAVMASAVGPA